MKSLAAMLAFQFAVGFALMGGALCLADCAGDEEAPDHATSHCRSHFSGLMISEVDESPESGLHFGVCSGPTCPCHQSPVVERTMSLVPDPEPVDRPHCDVEPLDPGVALDILHVPLA
jgi:hypothetical protein